MQNIRICRRNFSLYLLKFHHLLYFSLPQLTKRCAQICLRLSMLPRIEVPLRTGVPGILCRCHTKQSLVHLSHLMQTESLFPLFWIRVNLVCFSSFYWVHILITDCYKQDKLKNAILKLQFGIGGMVVYFS